MIILLQTLFTGLNYIKWIVDPVLAPFDHLQYREKGEAWVMQDVASSHRLKVVCAAFINIRIFFFFSKSLHPNRPERQERPESSDP